VTLVLEMTRRHLAGIRAVRPDDTSVR